MSSRPRPERSVYARRESLTRRHSRGHRPRERRSRAAGLEPATRRLTEEGRAAQSGELRAVEASGQSGEGDDDPACFTVHQNDSSGIVNEIHADCVSSRDKTESGALVAPADVGERDSGSDQACRRRGRLRARCRAPRRCKAFNVEGARVMSLASVAALVASVERPSGHAGASRGS
jgi:hypothetical protein